MRLKDKVAIVTGGANGLGLETTKVFIENGAKVVIADFDKVNGEKRQEEFGGDCLFVEVDVSNPESVENMVKKTIEKFGKIDILINNAGITRDAMLHKMTIENFDKVIDINLKGVFVCTQSVIPYMREANYGRIINTSSIVGVIGNVGQTNYAAAKAGLIGMTKTWAKELGKKGITVNAVAPGFINTAMLQTIPENVINKIKSGISLGELGEPSDIANAYLYLASDEARYITGHVLQVDGGIV